MTAFYNEIEPYAAAWLRNLIAAGHIAPGVVDERSIVDLDPDELAGYTQCHFFAGIGGWSYALRLAGWPDDRPVWTGSCPCQPFSAAGKGEGHQDERHLWPAWFRLIRERRPAVVFGEQVASSDGLAWLDPVCTDLEGVRYAVAAADLPVAGVGAPHIRQRLFFVGDSGGERVRNARRRQDARAPGKAASAGPQRQWLWPDARDAGGGTAFKLADDCSAGLPPREQQAIQRAGRREEGRAVEQRGSASTGVVADADGRHAGAEGLQRSGEHGQQPAHGGALHGFWSDADWIYCRDGKWRPVESGTFPLAHGAPARVGRLRAYGNAISPQAAEAFIRAYLGA